MRGVARLFLAVILCEAAITPLAGLAATVSAAEALPSSAEPCDECSAPEPGAVYDLAATSEEIEEGRQRGAGAPSELASRLGRLAEVVLGGQQLGLSGVDSLALREYVNVWRYFKSHPDAAAAYQASGAIPAEALTETSQRFGELPPIDVRVLTTLDYLVLDEAYGGAGHEWLRVPAILRGYRGEANQYDRGQAADAEFRTISPHHFGEALSISEVDLLRGTRFVYEAELSQEEAKKENPDLSKVDWTKAKLIDKLKLPPLPIQVGWQAGGGAVAGDGLPQLEGAFASALYDVMCAKQNQDIRERASERGLELSTATAPCTTPGAFARGLGANRIGAEYGLELKDGQFIPRAYAMGQAELSEVLSIPGYGITGGADMFPVAGAALLEARIPLPAGSLTRAVEQGATTDQIFKSIARRWIEKQLSLSTGSLDQAREGDPDSLKRAVGLGWLEATVTPNLTAADAEHPSLWESPTEAAFKAGDPLNYELIYGAESGRYRQSELGFSVDPSGKDPQTFLLEVGTERLDRFDGEQYNALDAFFGIAVKSGNESGRTWLDNFLSANGDHHRVIGSWVAVTHLSNDLATQNNLHDWFVSKLMPAGSAGKPLIDTGYIETRFDLLPGDLERIFVDGRGWEVARRMGNIGYIEGLFRQAEALNPSRLVPVLTGEIFVQRYESFKSQIDSLIRTTEAELESIPNAVLGSITASLRAQQSAMEREVFGRINERLAGEAAHNEFEQLLGGMGGMLAQLRSWAYGPDVIRQPYLAALNAVGNAYDQFYLPPGSTLWVPQQWREVMNNQGSTLGTYGIDANQFAAQAADGSGGTYAFDTFIATLGAEELGERLFEQVSGQVAGAVEQTAQQVGQYVREVKSVGQGVENFARSVGKTAQSLDPRKAKFTVDRAGARAFFLDQVLYLAEVEEWRPEAAFLFDLATDPNYQVTTDDVLDFLTGASYKLQRHVGATAVDVAYALNVARPFIKALAGEQSFESALQGAALNSGLGYLYGFVNQLDLGSPVMNQAAQIVTQELMGWGYQTLSDPNLFVEKNGPDTILASIGLLPARQRGENEEDYLRSKALAWRDFLRYSENPEAYRQENGNDPYRSRIDQAMVERGGDPSYSDRLIDMMQPIAGPLAEGTPIEGPTLTAFEGHRDALAAKFLEHRQQDLREAIGNPDGTVDEKARFARKQSELYTAFGINLDKLSDDERADLDGRSREFLLATRDGNVAAMESTSVTFKAKALESTFGAADTLSPRLERMKDRLIDLGITTLDDIIDPEGIVPGGPLRLAYKIHTIYQDSSLTDAQKNDVATGLAGRTAWTVLQRFVALPPEVNEFLHYLGGDPVTIAKTWNDGRLSTAVSLMTTSQLLRFTGDTGIALSVGEALMAHLGPTAYDLELIQQKSEVQAAAAAKAYADWAATTDPLTGGPGGAPATPSELERVRLEAYEQSVKQELADPRFKEELKQRRDSSIKHVRYATMDYLATLSVRSASGNPSVSMAGFAETMFEGTNRAKLLFSARTLASLNQSELAEYIHDGIAAYEIVTFYQDTQGYMNAVAENKWSEYAGSGGAPPPNRPKTPEAAFARIDARLSQLFGWQVPPGFTKGFFSFIASGFKLDAKFGALPSMQDILTSPSFQLYVGNWLDKTIGLPQGTTFTAWQLYVEIQQAQKAYAYAQQWATFANANPSAAAAALSTGGGAAAGTAASAPPPPKAVDEAIAAASTPSPPAATPPPPGGAPPGNTATPPVTKGSSMTQVSAQSGATNPSVANDAGVAAANDLKLAEAAQPKLASGAPKTNLNEAANAEVKKLAQKNLSAAGQYYATAVTVAINYVVNMAFGKAFAKLDAGLGLPPGTISTLVGAGIAIGVNAAFAAMGIIAKFSALAALGGPIGIALTVVGIIVSAIVSGWFGGKRKKKPKVKRQLVRTWYSGCGSYPGFEPEQPPNAEALTTQQLNTPATTAGEPGTDPTKLVPDYTAETAAIEATQASVTAAAVNLTTDGTDDPTNRYLEPPAEVTPEAAKEAFAVGDELEYGDTRVCPAVFEASASVQLMARVPALARHKVTILLGNVLSMPNRLGDNPERPFIRPLQILSYGLEGYHLAKLVEPYRSEIDRLYGEGGAFELLDPKKLYIGIGPDDRLVGEVVVSW